ncbi:MAG: hypothetical protein QOJ87_2271, partial [Verrucomicrobiota bacterium]
MVSPLLRAVFATILSICAAGALAQTSDTAKPLPEPRDAAVRDRERQAMIEFYNAMSGPDWIEREFWGSDRPVGEW